MNLRRALIVLSLLSAPALCQAGMGFMRPAPAGAAGEGEVQVNMGKRIAAYYGFRYDLPSGFLYSPGVSVSTVTGVTRFVFADGTVMTTAPIGGGGSGDIDSVTVSAPLTGGGTIGALSIGVDKSSATLLGPSLETGELPAGATLDTEWNTILKIETATGVDIITSGENNDSADSVSLADVQSAATNDFHNIGGTDDDTPDSDSEVPDTITVGASGSVNNSAIDSSSVTKLGASIDVAELPSGNTIDTEWDTAAEINAATTDADFSLTSHTHAGVYEPADADLTDLADGSLTGSKVGSGVPAANIATGSLGSAVVASSMAIAGFYSDAQVRTNLGLAIGTNVQAFDADLSDLADGSLTGSLIGSGVPAANIATGSLGASVMSSSMAVTGFYSNAAVRSGLGLAIGTDVQALDADLTDLADGSLTGTKIGDGVPAANIAAGTLDVDVIASTATAGLFYSNNQIRTNLGLAIGTNVEAFDADLDDLADGSLTGSKVGSGVPAANIAAGTIGNQVLVSSFPMTAVAPGSYTNTNLTVNAQGFITSASNGSAGGGGGASSLAVTTGGASGMSVFIASPTAIINFSSETFRVDLTGTATAYVTVLPSTVTLLGPSIDAGTAELTGTLAAARFPALTTDVTTVAGALAATIAADAVTYAKMQNVSAASKLLGRGDSGSGDPQEITLGTNLSITGTTLNASSSGGGVSVYPATATIVASFGVNATTASVGYIDRITTMTWKSDANSFQVLPTTWTMLDNDQQITGTTKTNVNSLIFTLPAATTWYVEARYNVGTSSGGCQAAIDIPVNATMRVVLSGVGTAATAARYNEALNADTTLNTNAFGTFAASFGIIEMYGYIYTGNGGDVVFQFAGGAASPGLNTTLRQGTFARLSRWR